MGWWGGDGGGSESITSRSIGKGNIEIWCINTCYKRIGSLGPHLCLSFKTKDNCILVRKVPWNIQNIHQQLPNRVKKSCNFNADQFQKQLLTAKSAPGPVSEARDSKMQMKDPLKHVIYSWLRSSHPWGSPHGIKESFWSLVIIIMAYLLEASTLLQD